MNLLILSIMCLISLSFSEISITRSDVTIPENTIDQCLEKIENLNLTSMTKRNISSAKVLKWDVSIKETRGRKSIDMNSKEIFIEFSYPELLIGIIIFRESRPRYIDKDIIAEMSHTENEKNEYKKISLVEGVIIAKDFLNLMITENEADKFEIKPKLINRVNNVVYLYLFQPKNEDGFLDKRSFTIKINPNNGKIFSFIGIYKGKPTSTTYSPSISRSQAISIFNQRYQNSNKNTVLERLGMINDKNYTNFDRWVWVIFFLHGGNYLGAKMRNTGNMVIDCETGEILKAPEL